MTPEELDRTIEFIIQHQAHVSANLEELSTQLKKEHRQRLKLQEWSMDLHRRLAELLEHQSRRLDWSEQFMQDWKTESRNESREAQKRHEEALASLDRILNKLSDKPN